MKKLLYLVVLMICSTPARQLRLIDSDSKIINKTELGIEMSCTFDAIPAPNITWTFNGTVISNDDDNYNVTSERNASSYQVKGTLKFRGIPCIGNTTATCKAVREGSEVAKTLTIEPFPNLALVGNLTAKTSKCNQNHINISWKMDDRLPSYLAQKVKYEVLLYSANGSCVNKTEFLRNTSEITFDDLQENTYHTFEVIASSMSCGRNIQQISTVTVHGIPLPPRNARVVNTSNSSLECTVRWEAPLARPISGIEYFTIIRKVSRVNYRSIKNGEQMMYRTDGTEIKPKLSPNTNNTFKIYATSCPGKVISANGYCLTDTAAPDALPNIVIFQAPYTTIDIHVPRINEENGLISCISIIAIQGIQHSGKKVQSLKDLIDISNAGENSSHYLAIAINYNGNSMNLNLGDGTNSSCSFNKNKTIASTNRPLSPGCKYRDRGRGGSTKPQL